MRDTARGRDDVRRPGVEPGRWTRLGGAGELAYNIEPGSPILPTRENAREGAQVDPAQRQSRTKGRSPRAIRPAGDVPPPTSADGTVLVEVAQPGIESP